MSSQKPKTIELNFELWPKQMEAFLSPATERLYGGAAGGGKSHFERVESTTLCLDVPGLQYFLFRRNYQDLIKSYVEGPTGYRAMLSELIHEGEVESVAKEIRFPNGSKIFLCHCQHEKDVFGFGSFEFHVLNIAEAGEFTPFMIRYLRSRVRMPEQFQERLPKKYLMPKQYWRGTKPEYQLPKISLSCNPIGPGKLELKRMFLDGHKPGEIWRASDDEGGMLRQFIPAKLTDNPSLDPVSYSAQLRGIGSQGYVDALLEGRWDATVGAFFPQINRAVHILKPHPIASHLPRFMAYDHGACGGGDPFSCGWYYIADGTTHGISAYTNEVIPIQRGSMVCYRRWNGRGLPKMDAKQIADGIHQREREEILFRVAGGDILEQRGHGESIFGLFSQQGINFIRADMRRQNGWAQVDYRLAGENDWPLSFWFQECEEDLETISTLQHDLLDPNDVAKGDDHDADRHRYACMTRPLTRHKPEENFQLPSTRATQITPLSIIKQIQRPQNAYIPKR